MRSTRSSASLHAPVPTRSSGKMSTSTPGREVNRCRLGWRGDARRRQERLRQMIDRRPVQGIGRVAHARAVEAAHAGRVERIALDQEVIERAGAGGADGLGDRPAEPELGRSPEPPARRVLDARAGAPHRHPSREIRAARTRAALRPPRGATRPRATRSRCRAPRRGRAHTSGGSPRGSGWRVRRASHAGATRGSRTESASPRPRPRRDRARAPGARAGGARPAASASGGTRARASAGTQGRSSRNYVTGSRAAVVGMASPESSCSSARAARIDARHDHH